MARNIDTNAARLVIDQFRAAGGTGGVSWTNPVETTQRPTLRVAGPITFPCAKEAMKARIEFQPPERCVVTDSPVPINAVGLSIGGEVVTDPSLVEDGNVTLLQFRAVLGVLADVTLSPASPDPRLGGVLPGLIVPQGGELAAKYGLVPSHTATLLLPDFGALPPQKRAALRSLIVQRSPAAMVSEERDGYVAQSASAATRTSTVGSATLAMLTLIAVFAQGRASHRWWRDLKALLAPVALIRSITIRFTAVGLGCLMACTAAGWLSARLLGAQDGTGFGWHWLIILAPAAFIMLIGLPWTLLANYRRTAVNRPE